MSYPRGLRTLHGIILGGLLIALATWAISPASLADDSDQNKIAQYIKLLQDPKPVVRKHGAAALGRMGTVAKDAIPTLDKLLIDEDEGVRIAAANALEAIAPVKRADRKPSTAVVKKPAMTDSPVDEKTAVAVGFWKHFLQHPQTKQWICVSWLYIQPGGDGFSVQVPDFSVVTRGVEAPLSIEDISIDADTIRYTATYKNNQIACFNYEKKDNGRYEGWLQFLDGDRNGVGEKSPRMLQRVPDRASLVREIDAIIANVKAQITASEQTIPMLRQNMGNNDIDAFLDRLYGGTGGFNAVMGAYNGGRLASEQAWLNILRQKLLNATTVRTQLVQDQ